MAWGNNKDGRLGDGKGQSGHSTGSSDVPVPVKQLTDATAIAAGQTHALAVLGDGSVVAWGGGVKGDLGDGRAEISDLPVQVQGLNEPAVAVAAGAVDSLVLMRNGTVMSFGGNEFGQIGNGHRQRVYLPEEVVGLKNVVAISAGEFHNLALLSDGTVMAWGWNEVGELGSPPGGPERCFPFSCSRTPVPVEGLSDVSEISAAQAIVNPRRTNIYNLARLGDGRVMAWGGNEYGQLGDATTTPSFVPVEVEGLTNAQAVSAGGFHSVAIVASPE